MSDLIGYQFIGAPNGTFDFGEIDDTAAAAINRAGGPIRLQHGFEGPKGFGNRHVEAYAERMRQLDGLGYRTFSSFVWRIAQNFQTIHEGADGKLVLVYRDLGRDLRIVISEATGNETMWTVTTGIPSRVCRDPIIYRVTRTDGSEPTSDVAQRPRLATLSLPKTPTTGGRGS